jgi:phosphatidylinositol glycan class B
MARARGSTRLAFLDVDPVIATDLHSCHCPNVRVRANRSFYLICLGSADTTVTFSTLAMITAIVVDSLYYQTSFVVFTPLNFFRENVLHNISLFYGSNPWHFYLTQAVPVTTWTLLPFVLYGSFRLGSPNTTTTTTTDETQRRHLIDARRVCLWTIFVYSLLGHKEFRFIQPLLPLFHVFAAHGLVSPQLESGSCPSGPGGKKTTPPPSPRTPSHDETDRHLSPLPIPASYGLFLIITCLVPSLYLDIWHSRGQVDVIQLLATKPADELRSVAFLVPCHSTPWQSHLHRADLEDPSNGGSGDGGKLWFLACEPPIRYVRSLVHSPFPQGQFH